jgi:hypothetical protein
MMTKPYNVILGGLEIPYGAAAGLSQSYEDVNGGRSLRRAASGAPIIQTAWRKWRTTLVGSGRLPPGLASLDYDAAMSLHCAAPMEVSTASTTATLPSARRSDFPPIGYAVVNGEYVRTAISIVVDTVTFAAVAGASRYVVVYFPVLTVVATSRPRTNFDARGVVVGWELTLEE